MTIKDKITFIPAIAVPVAIAISAIRPYDYRIWGVEIAWCLMYYLFLAALFPRFRFSNTAYFIAGFWCILQAIGAHYSFELVPLGEIAGFERNHYDRFAHFIVGVNAFLIAEALYRKKIVCNAVAAAIGGIFVIVAIAGIWEIIEWLYAEWDGGEVGAAFLGSQGDIWDAQKDILCDTLGGIAAAVFFLLKTHREKSLESEEVRHKSC